MRYNPYNSQHGWFLTAESVCCCSSSRETRMWTISKSPPSSVLLRSTLCSPVKSNHAHACSKISQIWRTSSRTRLLSRTKEPALSKNERVVERARCRVWCQTDLDRYGNMAFMKKIAENSAPALLFEKLHAVSPIEMEALMAKSM